MYKTTVPIYYFHQISKGFKPSRAPPKRKHASEETQKALNKFPNDSLMFPFSLSLFRFPFFSLHHLNAWNKLCIKILTHCSLFCFSVFLHSVCKFHWFSYQHCYSLQEKRQTFCLSQKCIFSFFLFFLALLLTFTLNHRLVQSTGNLACQKKSRRTVSSSPKRNYSSIPEADQWKPNRRHQ